MNHTAIQIPPSELERFLSAVLPTQGVYGYGTKRNGIFSRPLIDGTPATLTSSLIANSSSPSRNTEVFFAPASFTDTSEQTASNVALKRSLYIDLDCPKNYSDANAALKSLYGGIKRGIPAASIIVASGYGIHAYWCLSTDLPREDWLRLARTLNEACAVVGLHTDQTVTKDAARLLRLPGSTNWKKDHPKQCRILFPDTKGEIRTYATLEIEDALHKINCGGDSAAIKALGDMVGNELSQNLFPAPALEDVQRLLKAWPNDAEVNFGNSPEQIGLGHNDGFVFVCSCIASICSEHPGIAEDLRALTLEELKSRPGWTDDAPTRFESFLNNKHLHARTFASMVKAAELQGLAWHKLQNNPSAPSVWPDVEPLPPRLPPVPRLRRRMLPAAIQACAYDIADRMAVPPDVPAVGLVVSLCAVVGRNLGIKPKAKDDWTVVPNIYGIVVGEPASGKTPALAEAMNGIKRLEAELANEHKKECARHQAAQLQLEVKAKNAKKKLNGSVQLAEDAASASAIAASALEEVNNIVELHKNAGSDIPDDILQKWKSLKGGSDAAKTEADTQQQKVDQLSSAVLLAESELAMPPRPRLIINDATIEKAAELLNENPNGLLMFRDELSAFFEGLQRQGREGERPFWLEANNGNGSYTTDRIGRGTVRVEAMCLSILGGIQPERLRKHLTDPNVPDDGLLQRFQLLVYPDPRPFKNVDEYPDTHAKENLWGLIQQLHDLDPDTLGAEANSTYDTEAIPAVRFSSAGQTVFNRWYEDTMTRARGNDVHATMGAYLGKLPATVATIALVSYLCEGAHTDCSSINGAVTATHVRRGVLWATYLEKHAERAFSTRIKSTVDSAYVLLGRLSTLPDPFKARDVYNKGWAGLDRPAAQAAIAELVATGYLVSASLPTGGRPTIRYWKNPNAPSSEPTKPSKGPD